MESNLHLLREVLSTIAADRRLRLSYDTHYDAGNLELSWWQGKSRHRVDFQPLQGEPLQVTHLVDTYPYLPRLLFWCRRCIPMFPILPKVQCLPMGSLAEPCSKERVEQLVLGALPPNYSLKRTAAG